MEYKADYSIYTHCGYFIFSPIWSAKIDNKKKHNIELVANKFSLVFFVVPKIKLLPIWKTRARSWLAERIL